MVPSANTPWIEVTDSVLVGLACFDLPYQCADVITF